MPSRWDAATHGWSRRVFHYPLPTLMSRNFRLPCTIELQPLSLTPLKMRKVELSAVSVNKLVWLNGQDVRQHTPFRIHKRNLLRRIPRLGRRLFGSWVGDVPTVYPGDGSMRSVTQWQASHVSLFPSSVDYYFTDDNGGVSGPLAGVTAVSMVACRAALPRMGEPH